MKGAKAGMDSGVVILVGELQNTADRSRRSYTADS